MSSAIAPLRRDEVEEAGRFLAAGFGLAEGSASVSPEVLTWKYFDPRGEPDAPRAHVARDGAGGRIIGFIGLAPSTIHVVGGATGNVTTLHMMDWLGEKGASNAGAYLFLRIHRGVETGYGLGGSGDSRRVATGGGYERLADVPVFGKVLRPGYRLRAAGRKGLREAGRRGGAFLRAVKDTAELALNPGRRPAAPVALRRVEAFGTEVDHLLGACEPGLIHTSRGSDVLNHLLRHPGNAISGWRIERDGRPIGFALLAVVSQGVTRLGKIVECFLPARNPGDWHAAIDALAYELRVQDADVAFACGSTRWSAEALRAAGFRPRYPLEFRLRDKAGRVPRSLPFHLTFLEADYAYTA